MKCRLQDAEEWISNLEHRIMEREKRIMENDNRLGELKDSIKHFSIHIRRVAEEEDKEIGKGIYLKN